MSNERETRVTDSVKRLVGQHLCDWWNLSNAEIYFYTRRWFRRLGIRLFFGFCEFAVTHRGGMYLIRAALVPVHLFEFFKNLQLGFFHKR